MDDPPQHLPMPHPWRPLPALPSAFPDDPSRWAEVIAVRQAILEERLLIIAGRIEQLGRALRSRGD